MISRKIHNIEFIVKCIKQEDGITFVIQKMHFFMQPNDTLIFLTVFNNMTKLYIDILINLNLNVDNLFMC